MPRKGKGEERASAACVDIWWIRFWCVSAAPPGGRSDVLRVVSSSCHGSAGATNDATACTSPMCFAYTPCVHKQLSTPWRLLQVHSLSVCTESMVPRRSLQRNEVSSRGETATEISLRMYTYMHTPLSLETDVLFISTRANQCARKWLVSLDIRRKTTAFLCIAREILLCHVKLSTSFVSLTRYLRRSWFVLCTHFRVFQLLRETFVVRFFFVAFVFTFIFQSVEHASLFFRIPVTWTSSSIKFP